MFFRLNIIHSAFDKAAFFSLMFWRVLKDYQAAISLALQLLSFRFET